MNGKLLIVEDQTYFRKGLRKMIEQHDIGWTVVGEAEHGQEALRLIAGDPPDLILTDIRMPGMDGIELAEHVHRERPDIDLIMLTGYEDFKYAQAALRYGAIDFLLKPCNEETLLEVLRKAYDHFHARQRQKMQLLAGERAKEESLLRAYMLRLPHDAAAARQVVEHCRNKELMFVTVDSYYPEDKRYTTRDLGLLQFALFNILDELLEEHGLKWRSVPLEFDRFALFADRPYPDAFLSSAKQNVLRYLGIRIRLVPAGRVTMPDELPDVYERLCASMAPSWSEAGHGGASFGIPDQQTRVKELQAQLSAYIALGRIDHLKRMLGDATRRLAALAPEAARMEALTLVLAMNATAKQAFDLPAATAVFGDRLDELQRTGSQAEAMEWAKRAAEAFLAEYDEWRAGKSRSIVAMALDYLDSHYMESCSLTDLAERFHISAAYFSKLFKKETGDNFSSYLTKLRMRKAAMLLLNTDMKVFEIASAVGYDDPNYFTNVFRMLYHLSPSDYRKQHK